MDAPKWLADEPVIQQILIRFLDRLDKRKEDSTANKLQSIQLTPKDFPELFFPTGQNDPQQTWNLLWELDTQQLRSEEHTSELQSRPHLVCRLLLEKKKKKKK